ncbi:hypothetical protein PQU92_13475 [Asticcacaulis sp. BYS171W]|uniref:Glycerophosphoryl diester phosphodiesterase membrane domain-containing protein n=1 Tax=Asticcacaulis aquaticus TaxID=2984212 RepID=A0ABT5HWE5_9CAUL|nr:hypothetical protein [Asticcacaulis aquaticus]MDC7684294.1 hypothetical protein [Asticcacaulis aquaticus]
MALSVDFAFEGFRIIRERPILIAWWGAVLLVGVVLSTALLMSVAGPEWNALIQGQVPEDPQKAADIMLRFGPAYLLTLMMSLIFNAVITCGVYRAVLGGHSPRFGYLRLGADEVRQIVLYFILLFLVLVVGLTCAVVLSIVGGLLSMIAGAVMSALVPLVGALTFLAAVMANIWLMVRLSMVSVQSFEERHLNITGSLRLTQGRFWSLLGGFALAFLLTVVVIVLFQSIYMALAALISGKDIETLSEIPRPDMSQLANILLPLNALSLLVSGLIAPLTTAILVGAGASAYKMLKAARAV